MQIDSKCRYVHQLEGVTAVISCVGGFGSQEEMQRINGEANVSIIEAAKVAGVPRCGCPTPPLCIVSCYASTSYERLEVFLLQL